MFKLFTILKNKPITETMAMYPVGYNKHKKKHFTILSLISIIQSSATTIHTGCKKYQSKKYKINSAITKQDIK